MTTNASMATLSEVAGVVHQQQHLPSEIVKNLRLNFKPFKQDIHEENKVQIRTSRHYKPEKDQEQWKDNYHRHLRQKSCGFYTPAHIPYQTVGKVGLDLKELVEDSLDHLTKRQQPDMRIWKKSADKERISRRKETMIRFEDKPNIQGKLGTAPRVPISRRRKGEVLSSSRCDGGLEEIRSNVRLHRLRKAAVRAGKPYFECIRDEAEAKAKTLMKEEKSRRDPCISPMILQQMLSKMRVAERSDSQVEGDESTDGLPPEDSHVDILNQREVHDRSTRTFTAKLNCLHSLLCYLYNLRTKDLRTKTPLSKDFLKTLRANLPVDHRGHIIRNTRQQTSNPPSRSRNTDHRSSVNTIEYPRNEPSFPMGSPHMYWNDSGSSISRVVGGGGESSSCSANIFQRKFGTRAKEGGPKITEMTWSELIEGRSPTQQCGPPPPPELSSRNAPGRSSFMHAVRNLFRFKKTGPHHNMQPINPNAQPFEQLPLWQQVASSEKNAKEAKSTKVHRHHRSRPVHQKKRRFSKMHEIIGQDFTQIRIKTAAKVVERLQQLSEQEREMFTQRLKAIQPAKLFELNLRAMRQAGIDVHKEYENDHIQPAKWFDDLHEKAEILGVQDEPLVIECLGRLQKFAVDQIHTLAYVKAKLCLITQSIQMYDLCSLEMQEAIYFLMTRIMDISFSTWTDWLGQRKIHPLPPA